MSMDQVENIAEHIDPQSYKERLEKGVVKTSFLADSGNHHVDNGRRQGSTETRTGWDDHLGCEYVPYLSDSGVVYYGVVSYG